MLVDMNKRTKEEGRLTSGRKERDGRLHQVTVSKDLEKIKTVETRIMLFFCAQSKVFTFPTDFRKPHSKQPRRPHLLLLNFYLRVVL